MSRSIEARNVHESMAEARFILSLDEQKTLLSTELQACILVAQMIETRKLKAE